MKQQYEQMNSRIAEMDNNEYESTNNNVDIHRHKWENPAHWIKDQLTAQYTVRCICSTFTSFLSKLNCCGFCTTQLSKCNYMIESNIVVVVFSLVRVWLIRCHFIVYFLLILIFLLIGLDLVNCCWYYYRINSVLCFYQYKNSVSLSADVQALISCLQWIYSCNTQGTASNFWLKDMISENRFESQS